mmetsp:Transcript_34228/g.52553  ORF Transcript_34228/g.52553 Transcript_34228/m.52553 type:complete len:315 (-) Transcript_34228:423-1367(-)
MMITMMRVSSLLSMMRFLLLLSLVVNLCFGFVVKPTSIAIPRRLQQQQQQQQLQQQQLQQPIAKALCMSGKGFGQSPSPNTNEPEKRVVDAEVITSKKTTIPAVDSSSTSSKVVEEEEEEEEISPGRQALIRMRQLEQERKDEALRGIKQLIEVDEAIKDTPAAIPEKVAMRMGKRMLPFVGIPLFGGMGTFVAFWYLATYKNFEFQPALVAFTTIGFLAVGLLGISYSVVSASWDEDDAGSFFGVNEFKENVGRVKDGLRRSRDNAELRDIMESMPQDQLDKALRDLEQRETSNSKKKKKRSIQEIKNAELRE